MRKWICLVMVLVMGCLTPLLFAEPISYSLGYAEIFPVATISSQAQVGNIIHPPPHLLNTMELNGEVVLFFTGAQWFEFSQLIFQWGGNVARAAGMEVVGQLQPEIAKLEIESMGWRRQYRQQRVVATVWRAVAIGSVGSFGGYIIGDGAGAAIGAGIGMAGAVLIYPVFGW